MWKNAEIVHNEEVEFSEKCRKFFPNSEISLFRQGYFGKRYVLQIYGGENIHIKVFGY